MLNTDPASIAQAMLDYGVDRATAQTAAQVIERTRPALLAVTGKLAAGKDTIAPAVLARLGADRVFHLSFATALKDELDAIIAALRAAADHTSAVAAIMAFDATPAQAERIVHLLADEVLADPALTSRSRTANMRIALQFWGSDVRRSAHPDWWVRQAVRTAAARIAAGDHIMVTDVRFPNEVIACQAIGFTVVRLIVTPQTQAARLLERDGLAPDPAALAHPSETALDDYADFDLVIDNNGDIAPTVNTISDVMRTATLLLAARE